MGYTESEAKAFISYIAPIIREEATKRGYPICSTAIAQAIVEGAAGTSTLAKLYHNHFGMKVSSSYKGKSVRLRTKEEYAKGQLVTIYADFRAYANDIEGVKGYYDFLQYKRYDNLHYAKDYRQYAEYLKKDGWATSSTYRDNLIGKVEKYNLQKWYDITLEYFPKYSGETQSIVVALESLGVDASFPYREKIYKSNFSDSYRGTEKQNLSLLEKLKKGQLIKPKNGIIGL